MRRFKQQLPATEVEQILTTSTHGILSLVDAQGSPYGVPLSFVYDGKQSIYFHCAREGRKIDCICHNDRASLCIVTADDIQPAAFTTYFRSIIVSGRVQIISQAEEVMAALQMLGQKYAPGIDSTGEIRNALERVTVLRLDIENASGKEAIELTRKRKDVSSKK